MPGKLVSSSLTRYCKRLSREITRISFIQASKRGEEEQLVPPFRDRRWIRWTRNGTLSWVTRYKCMYLGDNGRENNQWRYGEGKKFRCATRQIRDSSVSPRASQSTDLGATPFDTHAKNDPRSPRWRTYSMHTRVRVCLLFQTKRNKSGHVGFTLCFLFHENSLSRRFIDLTLHPLVFIFKKVAPIK